MSAPSADPTGQGFNLVMELADPNRLPELMKWLDPRKNQIRAAFGSLGYVHYARFLPIWNKGLLLIVSEFDGEMKNYILDFAAVLDEEFTTILTFMKGPPRLPVSRYPEEFWNYVHLNSGPHEGPMALPSTFSAYPGRSVLDIVGASRPIPEPTGPAVRAVELTEKALANVQANVLRGFKARKARYLGFEFPDAERGRKLLAQLNAKVTTHATQVGSPDLPVCVTIGLTHAGLQALGLPLDVLSRFPAAFREGPRLRAGLLGDTGRSAPEHWSVAGYEDRQSAVVHAMLSIYGRLDATTFDSTVDCILELIEKGGGRLARGFDRSGQSLGAHGDEVHFGYRDGLGQPRVRGLPGSGNGRHVPEAQKVHAGDVLLGADYPNSRNGYYIGELPEKLASQGTYAALRVIRQDVKAFDDLLTEVANRHDVLAGIAARTELPSRPADRHALARELVAAKLMGRWRDGAPLAKEPERATVSTGAPPAPHRAADDDFDFLAPAASFDDFEGRRCPLGAHVRRLNPRSGPVIGKPLGRRVVRRGMSYGPRYDPTSKKPEETDPNIERGLVGLFICADLESQFEFVQRVWANADLSAPGLRHSQDPFVGAREQATPFRFRPTESAAEITIMVPPLSTTRGSAYFFMPGIGGLNWLAAGAWAKEDFVSGQHRPDVQTPTRTNVRIDPFDPTDPIFLQDPYRYYAAFRDVAPVARVEKLYKAWWVFSRDLVADVCERKDEFLKPGSNRAGAPRPVGVVASQFRDGLFFMDPPRHDEARKIMDEALGSATKDVRKRAKEIAEGLLDEAVRQGIGGMPKGRIEAIEQFAAKLTTLLFMEVLGVPSDGKAGDPEEQRDVERRVLNGWVRTALASHDKNLPLDSRMRGATARLAMQTYFQALLCEASQPTDSSKAGSPHASPSSRPTLLRGMRTHPGCPASATSLAFDEAVNTAIHFALGGYLSTEFLIGSGLYNLLSRQDQWHALRETFEKPGCLSQAVREMLRFDAPFQMADRWVGKDTRLGGQTIEGGSIVTVVYGSANRDPHSFEHPDRFNITRSDSEQHFGFGDGIHRCIGKDMAQAVTEAAFEALIERCPTARIAEFGEWGTDPYYRNLKKLVLHLS